MFEQTGIGLDDLPWIQRDQYVYYLEMARALTVDPHDWPQLRADLLRALTAAFGLDHPDHGCGSSPVATLTGRQRRAAALLDDIRTRHDPATDWPAFFDDLWNRRHHLRPDL